VLQLTSGNLSFSVKLLWRLGWAQLNRQRLSLVERAAKATPDYKRAVSGQAPEAMLSAITRAFKIRRARRTKGFTRT
jgi:hypothetical protein